MVLKALLALQVLGILRVLAECGHFNDEHLDMLWGVTEQVRKTPW